MQHSSGKSRPLTLLRILMVKKNHYKGKLQEENWQDNGKKLREKNLKNKEFVRIIYCSVNLRDINCNFNKSNGEKKIC